ncbi:MAG: acetolactate synthase large subunit [Rhodospirillales bacterium]|nr:acetolactate synthase large subunit [Rhodospirillales bacterium]MBO6786961.1 acetolactate synthase large subunit [Rhodospirillales bacterium]
MNGAESLVRTLADSGVDVCFANPGTSEMHFVAALDRLDLIYCVLALQENVATGAADAYARMTGQPAATLLHLGPGFGNGLANVHNAKKARVPMVNIVGEHATYHIEYDAPLTSDIQGIVGPVSDYVVTTKTAEDVGADTAKAVAKAKTWPGKIATLILPADAAWNETSYVGVPLLADPPEKVIPADVEAVAKALKSGKKAVMFMSGAVLYGEGLEKAGKVAAATGATLLAQTSNRRIDRGAGRVAVNKLPYPIDHALETLKDYEVVILLGANEPVGFFAYPNKPSRLSPDGAEILNLAGPNQNTLEALDMLIDALGAQDAEPELVEAEPAPDVSGLSGPITPEIISLAFRANMPADAIVVDESITTGRAFFPDSRAAPPHTWLQNTGGAIGVGMPYAVGAAMACPDRRVIVLQSDGSGMYCNQALWTMAREGLDVTVLIFSNRAYRILEGEMKGVGVDKMGHVAEGLFGLNQPEIDWVSLAKGMGVEATRVDDAADLSPAIADALSREGPYLIEIVF